MRHVTAHISIWNKLGWIGIICYFVFAAAAPEVLTEGNQWIGRFEAWPYCASR